MKNYWKLKLSRIAIGLCFALCPFLSIAQLSKPEFHEDSEKYIYPVHPGQPGSLAGTMGELRTTHFHSGIDIRTNNMTGYPVVASKTGYISRITMTPAGYGNIIYISHPDGNTTLYAHLDKFVGPVALHVLQEQYKQKRFSIDLNFPEGKFPVKQGELIALSGNTGSSGGPHLHFDIRDKDNYALDPLKVASFPELSDKLPPAPEKIALKTMDKNSRINDRFGRFEFYASNQGNNKYSMATPILASGTIGIEIIAKDRLAAGSPFFGGVNYIEVRVDSQLVFSQAIDKIDISETRGIYTVMDFKTMRNKGSRFYKLYIDDGNNLKFYNNSPGSGRISIKKNKTANINIRLKDSYGNKSEIDFEMFPSNVMRNVPHLETMTTPVFTDYYENTFLTTFKTCADSTAHGTVFTQGKTSDIRPDYFNQNRSVFLTDLRKSLPDSIVYCGQTVVTNLKNMILPNSSFNFSSDYAEVVFSETALYDTLYFTSKYALENNEELFSIGDRNIPLNKSISVSLKPRQKYNPSEGYAVYRTAGKSYSFLGGEFSDGKVSFTTRELGDFTILKDDVQPTIKPIVVDRSSARFKVRDNLSGINSIEAKINGQWLLMHYDNKSNTIWSEKLDKNLPLKGDFELIITDNAGNKNVYSKKIL
jgi:hypothetical protein